MRTPPTDIASLARFILSSECQSIVVLTGAGVSVASGIPDFRSPGGMYDTLRPELFTATNHQRELMKHDPTYVVSWDIFQDNAFPYLELRKPFIIGTYEKKWKATLAHRFFELLYTKTKRRNGSSKLQRLYTQNIDGLQYQCTQMPRDKIVSVHGTIAEIQCEGCYNDMNYTDFIEQVRTNIKDIYHPTVTSSTLTTATATTTTTITATTTDQTNIENDNDQNETDSVVKESKPILCPSCHKPLVKPKTVLFGRSLPEQFFDCIEQDLHHVDLLIIAGTSLVVSPANSIAYSVPESTIRVIINHVPVGKELGIQYHDTICDNEFNKDMLCGRDLFLQGPCDEICFQLMEHLQWLSDIQLIQSELPEASAQLLSTKAYTMWF